MLTLNLWHLWINITGWHWQFYFYFLSKLKLCNVFTTVPNFKNFLTGLLSGPLCYQSDVCVYYICLWYFKKLETWVWYHALNNVWLNVVMLLLCFILVSDWLKYDLKLEWIWKTNRTASYGVCGLSDQRVLHGICDAADPVVVAGGHRRWRDRHHRRGLVLLRELRNLYGSKNTKGGKRKLESLVDCMGL